MLNPINCGGRYIFPQTVFDWKIGALGTAQYVNQPPSSPALHPLQSQVGGPLLTCPLALAYLHPQVS